MIAARYGYAWQRVVGAIQWYALTVDKRVPTGIEQIARNKKAR